MACANARPADAILIIDDSPPRKPAPQLPGRANVFTALMAGARGTGAAPSAGSRAESSRSNQLAPSPNPAPSDQLTQDADKENEEPHAGLTSPREPALKRQKQPAKTLTSKPTAKDQRRIRLCWLEPYADWVGSDLVLNKLWCNPCSHKSRGLYEFSNSLRSSTCQVRASQGGHAGALRPISFSYGIIDQGNTIPLVRPSCESYQPAGRLPPAAGPAT